jgi:hypothetical protein
MDHAVTLFSIGDGIVCIQCARVLEFRRNSNGCFEIPSARLEEKSESGSRRNRVTFDGNE